eukprot:symbB.v1.2.019766.t1/scaffold1596.1/size109882/5
MAERWCLNAIALALQVVLECWWSQSIQAFVSPPNKHALAVACQPGRAAFVARDVARLVAEAKQSAVEWKNQKHQFAFKTLRPPLTLVMDCVRSTQNVGSLLRTCAVAGVEVIFCGITPAPPMPAVLKSAGVAAAVPSSFAVCGEEAVKDLQEQGFEVWALETTDGAKELETLLGTFDISTPLALVVGHESYGVSAGALRVCDEQVRITTVGIKNSLNVAVAGSIAIFEIAQRRSG